MVICILAVVLALACAPAPAAAWPSGAPPTDAEQVHALINSGLAQLAVERAALSTTVPQPLRDEARLRAALERAERREVERLLANLTPSATTHLARAVLALERGQNQHAEVFAKTGIPLASHPPQRPLWELCMVRATALLRMGRLSAAVSQLLAMPAGRDSIPWSPYVTLLQLTELEDPDRERLVHMALQADPFGPEVRAFAVRMGLIRGDREATDRQFFEHARLRGKHIPRFMPKKNRRFGALPQVPLHGPIGPSEPAVILGEFARLAVSRDSAGQARRCQSLAAQHGLRSTEARWHSARIELALGETTRARAALEPLVREFQTAAPELAWAQAWTGGAKQALQTLGLASRPRAAEPISRMARIRALIDEDRPAAEVELAKEGPELGMRPDYWALVALSAHRRRDAAAVARAIRQLMILRRMGRINELECMRLAGLLRELGNKNLAPELLRPGGKDPEKHDFDQRPMRFSSVVYRLLADRAALTGDPAAALKFLGHARDSLTSAVLGRIGCAPSDLDATLAGFLPRLAYEGSYPIAQVAARIYLQVNDPPAALRELDVFVAHPAPLSSAWFLLEAAALGQMGRRDRTSSMVAAGTLLGVRVGIPWGAFAQLLLVTGSDEGLHALARAARALQDAGDDLDDLVALLGLGGLYVDALQTAVPVPGRGAYLGRGLALAAFGRDAEARLMLGLASAAPGPWASPALAALADLEFRAGRVAETRAALKAMEGHKIDDYRVHVVRAMVAILEGDTERAAKSVEQARSRGPHAAAPHLIAARLGGVGHNTRREMLREAARVAPHDSRAWEELGRHRLANHADPRVALRESVRQAVDAGELARATTVLGLLSKLPPQPPRPRYPYTDSRALLAAFNKLFASGPAALTNDQAGQDLAREAALNLVELGDDAGALEMVKQAEARGAYLVSSGPGGPAGPDPLPRNAAALLIATLLFFGPALAGRGLRMAGR